MLAAELIPNGKFGLTDRKATVLSILKLYLFRTNFAQGLGLINLN